MATIGGALLPHLTVVAGWHRRDVLRVLGYLGFSAATGCGQVSESADDRGQFAGIDPDDYFYEDTDQAAAADRTIAAAMAVLLPSDFDAAGALEVEAMDMLRLENFIPTARTQNLLPPLPAVLDREPEVFDEPIRIAIAATLDGLASAERPLVRFSRLSDDEKGDALDRGFDDPAARPMLLFLRAACFLAWLGAVRSDAGLVAIGYPPFENFDDGVAVSGYPRTTDGRLVDAENEDLDALAAAGMLDDYTYNRAPEPTPGDDLSLVLDAGGDLI